MYLDVYAQNAYKNFALIVCGFLNLMGMAGAIMINTDLVKRSGVWSGESKTIEGDILSTILSDFIDWFLSDGIISHWVRSLGAVFVLVDP